jgi:hypothetical protein
VQTKKQRDENEGFLSFLFGTGKNANGQVLVDPVKTGNNGLNGKAPYPRGRATQPKNIPAHVKGTASITRTYSSQAVPGKAKPKGMMMSNSTGGRPKSGTVEATPGWSTLLAEYAMANESRESNDLSVLHLSNTVFRSKTAITDIGWNTAQKIGVVNVTAYQ